jgi:hypothetical protein|tara:strand:- start:466 stop:615 length:150 start_codon:yes stop_codon:yes gene_type:complete
MKSASKKDSLKNFTKTNNQAMKKTGNFVKGAMNQMGKNATFNSGSKRHA